MSIIKRITRKKLREVLATLTKEDLKYIARHFDLPVSGNKNYLIELILLNVRPTEVLNFINTNYHKKMKMTTKISEDSEEVYDQIFKKLVKILRKLKVPNKIKKEKELELYILGFLYGKFGNKVKITPQAIGMLKGKLQRPDIVIDDKIAIELKYIRDRSKTYNGLGQLFHYNRLYPYVILYCYDPTKKIGKDFFKEFQKNENIAIIVSS